MSLFQGLAFLLAGGYLAYVAPDVASRLSGAVPERVSGGADVLLVRAAGVVLSAYGAVLAVTALA